MRSIPPLFFSLLVLVSFFLKTTLAQQDNISSFQAAATTTSVSLTPEMSASSVASYFSALATSAPIQPGDPTAGDAGSSAGSGIGDTNAGASGPDSGSITLSRGGIVAIVVCVAVVAIFGIASSVLFYLAKKRSWQVRATIRRSARRVATALTPRRSTFPKDVQSKRRSGRGLTKIEEVPPTPRTRSDDIEKANSKLTAFEMSEPQKQSKWARKLGR